MEEKDFDPSQMTPTQVSTTNGSWVIAKKVSINQNRGRSKITPIKDKDSELSQKAPPASLYEKQFMSYSQKSNTNQKRGLG